MSPFLLSLHQEYKDLKRKLQKLSDLLTEYDSTLIEDATNLSEAFTATHERRIAVDSTRLPQQSIKSLEESISTTVDHSIQLSQQFHPPTNTTEHFTAAIKPITNSTSTNVAPLGFEYPIQGTWKDKIFYALRVSGKPSKAAELAAFMCKSEPAGEGERVLSMVRQYCCNLGKDGTLGVQTVGRSNLYFLKS